MAFMLPLTLLLIALTSCSEESTAVDEYADWQNRNEQYISQLYTTVQAKVAAGDATWAMLPAYTRGADATLTPADYIYVQKLENGTETTTSPMVTDYVAIHYSGRLLPTVSYPEGLQFDASYSGTFNAQAAVPASSLKAGSYIAGFTTALLHMHPGDRWRVTIPYQLGYGTTASGSIPAYSTLIFDIILDDYWMTEKGDRYQRD